MSDQQPDPQHASVHAPPTGTQGKWTDLQPGQLHHPEPGKITFTQTQMGTFIDGTTMEIGNSAIMANGMIGQGSLLLKT